MLGVVCFCNLNKPIHHEFALLLSCLPLAIPATLFSKMPINGTNSQRPRSPIPPIHYHINLCTLPGSLDHSNSFPKKTAHVITFTMRNHSVSPHNLVFSTLNPASEPWLGCTCSRHNTHGRIKYRGSTRGAVIKDNAVERSQMSANDVFVSAEPLLPSFCTEELASFPRCVASCELLLGPCPQSARSANQPQSTYIGVSAYFISGCRKIVYRNT